MIRTFRVLGCGALCAVLLAGCNVLKTTDSESVETGAGSQSFNPYGSSSAIRMALQNFNGCAVAPNAIPYGAGDSNVPYPASCMSYDQAYLKQGPMTGTPPMPVLTGTQYFLGQLSLVDETFYLPTQGVTDAPSTPEEAVKWMTTQSRFAGLDWGGLAQFSDDVVPSGDTFERVVEMKGANWMAWHNDKSQDWQFKVEVIDNGGKVVNGPVVYNRSDFFAENPISMHTQVQFRQINVTAPTYPGDRNLHQGPNNDWPYPLDVTQIRIDMEGSTNPFKTFSIPSGISGDGAIRVTWSLMPNQPFYFPVTFVQGQSSGGQQVVQGSTCYDSNGATTPCTFGLSPTVSLSTPANGKYFRPGETFTLKYGLNDALGHQLFAPGALPSWSEYKNAEGVPGELKTNGLLYQDYAFSVFYRETEHASEVQVAGPIQNLRPIYSLLHSTSGQPYFQSDFNDRTFTPQVVGYSLPGMDDVHRPNEKSITLPKDAQPGTYVALVKATRQFMGERVSKTKAFFFQVGQEERTKYPGRVGNCQICHRGVLSLDNLLHGLSVDNIEGCKACHAGNGANDINSLIPAIHRIHMSSDKFPLPKRECVTCHLTKESALRPSLAVCGACHESIHGDKFFAMQFSTDPTNNQYSNCAQACHVVNPPALHVLPEN